ncbi:hypothetical protein IV454_15205 [Massilia antarctica]|uniref:Uncharacterized protein n=1 Tax=Massilia antarctica TaxID=2765360 RepID=A0AA48WJI5_9BURK|nr:hypothetical protein [Massilia antarctica]QPI52709.1 hypothetical protein IV454_15205 [Massilia antarctica]
MDWIDRLRALSTRIRATKDLIPAVAPVDKSGIVTTPAEVEGSHIVRSIPREVVGSHRVVMLDALSYCAILLDDNNRTPICRLRFNNAIKLAIGQFNEKKEEERILLTNLDSPYDHTDRLRTTALSHL